MQHQPLMLQSRSNKEYRSRCSCGWHSEWDWLDDVHVALTHHIINNRPLVKMGTRF